MKNFAARAALAVATSALASGLALAGVVIEFEHRSDDSKKPDKQRSGTMFLDKDRLRMQGDDHGAIFRADKQVLWVLDESKGTYHELTKEQMKQIGDQMAAAMKQLEGLPPEQRKMVEQMMAGKMEAMKGAAAKSAEPLAYKKTGKTETINGFSCVSYDVMRGDKREQEVWVTDWKSLGLTASDFKAFQDFGLFMKDMVGPIAKHFSISFEQSFSETDNGKGLPGVPIRTIVYGQDGTSVVEMKKIAKEDVPAAKFELPAGLKKQEIGMKVQTQITEPD